MVTWVPLLLPAEASLLLSLLEHALRSKDGPSICFVLFPTKAGTLAMSVLGGAEPRADNVAQPPPPAVAMAPQQSAAHSRELADDASLTLDASARVIVGLEMEPLVMGELRLLEFLGGCPRRWFSTQALATAVYGRSDAAGRQLVWKYASTLRRKLTRAGEQGFVVCRRRGYSFNKRVISQ